MSKLNVLAICLSLILSLGLANGALAQCGGSGSMHDQHMGSAGHMGSGQMGMYGSQAPTQPDPNAGYAAPYQPYTDYTGTQQDTSGYGSMMGSGQAMGQGGMGSGHSGHMGR